MLSVLVHSFDKYRFLWDGCVKSWPALSVPMYFGTDIQTNYDFKQFSPIYSGEGEWSDRLTKLLVQIKTPYVLYAQEDHWPTLPPPDLKAMMRIVKKHNLLRLHLGQVNQYYKLKNNFFEPDSKYLVSHQPSIWDRRFFISCLKPNETPWVNEYEGTKRILYKHPKRIMIYPCDWYDHKCVKGKLI